MGPDVLAVFRPIGGYRYLLDFFCSGIHFMYFYFQRGTSFVYHLCYLCIVFVMHLRLFIAALWSPAGKGLTT